ncbi:phosphoglycerate dehydrogenase [uncultured Paludibaculum sp.]|uniref:phosphoglycerate dehydrogenase n=1 Tax=uncultured Paludibaculum sp. TaxID=1765020 RepID=UPI002AAC47F1|nr:phosphoglycerate dehydrogenase [uncultured Paludibaculum sp.]
MKILVAEPLSPAAIALLNKQSGWDIVVSNPKEYEPHLADCDALLVRSAVKVKADTLAKAPKLRVIARAGVGVDNVDLPASTAAGVLVMNTPGGNAVSVAEHTLAMMLGLARMVPEASASTRSGKWEKKKFLGNELRGKTLGVVGLGNIGQEVVRRARGFEMRIIASDPYVNPATAAHLGVELVSLDELLAGSDYISLHLAVTPETRGMINAANIARMKDGVRIINCARGELVDQDALCEALVSKKVAGAGLDVFEPEPLPAGHPLLQCENLIATPHIAGSTEEAQEIVGIRIVEQLIEYLQNGVAINAVNMPAVTPEQYKAIGGSITLAERLGKFAAYVSEGHPKGVRVTYFGRIAEMNTNLVRNAALAGVLSRGLSNRVNLVNSMQVAAQRNLTVSESHQPRSVGEDSVLVEIDTDQGVTSVSGSIILDRARLLSVNGIRVESTLAGPLIYMRNVDVPGVIGHVGTVLGRNSVNIANFSLGRQDKPSAPGEPLIAVALVEVDSIPGEAVLDELRAHPAVKLAVTVQPGD